MTNQLGTGGMTRPGPSWIHHWRKQAAGAGLKVPPAPVCFAVGCTNAGTDGGHVKRNSSYMARVLTRRYWVAPACRTHNKGLSCGTYMAKKGTILVEAPASLLDRMATLPYEVKKVVAAMDGRHH